MSKLIKQAFTLIELLVVIAIIGILSGLIVVTMGGVTTKANIAKAQVFSNSLKNSLMLNLVSEWKLDQVLGSSAPYTTPDTWSGGNTGTLTDTSGACSFTGTLKCPQLVTSGCVSGNCLSFDGTDDYISVADNSNLNMGTSNFSVGLWVKASPISANSWLIGKEKSDLTQRFNFYLRPTNPFVQFALTDDAGHNVGLVSSLSTRIDDNAWHYAFVSIDRSSSTGGKLYIDGVFMVPGDFTSITGTISNTNILSIGTRYTTSASSFLNGLIDDVRIYNVAIPTSQIKEQYYAGLNNLLVKGEITKQDYQNRVGELAVSL